MTPQVEIFAPGGLEKVRLRGIGRLFPNRAHCLLESMRYRIRDFSLPPEIDGLVISAGGVGTTSVLDHLSRYIRTNEPSDSDRLKHRRQPPKNDARSIPVLLIVGDPLRIVESLTRRDYLVPNAIRLGCFEFFLLPKFLNLPVRAFNSAIKRQSALWQLKYNNLLVLDYSELFESPDLIATHFKIHDPSFIQNFPTRNSGSTLDLLEQLRN